MKGSIRVGIWCVFVLSTLHADFAAALSLQWARTYQGPLLEIGTGAALAPDEGGLYAVAVRTDWGRRRTTAASRGSSTPTERCSPRRGSGQSRDPAAGDVAECYLD